MEYDQDEADSLRRQVLYQKLADDRRISRNAPWQHPDARMPDEHETEEWMPDEDEPEEYDSEA